MLMQSSEGGSCGEEGGGTTLQAADTKGQQNKFFKWKLLNVCAQHFLSHSEKIAGDSLTITVFFKTKISVITRPGCPQN